MDPRVWLLLLGACCVPGAAMKNASSRLRTFVMRPGGSVTDEPLDLDSLYYDEDFDPAGNRSYGVRLPNATAGGVVSEEALLFLTGPVSTVFMPCFYTLVCVLSVPVNLCAVLAFARGIRPKKPAAIYMLNLAAADLLFAALLPFRIFYHLGGNHWVFGGALCRLLTAAFYWNMYCSVLLIACISVDRLLAVVYPIDSLAWRRPRNAVAACVSMWLLSLAGSAPLVVSEQTVFVPELNVTTCHDVQLAEGVAWMKVYFLVLCAALFFLPLVVTVASYARVIFALSAVPKAVTGSSRRRSRAVVMALTVLVIFLLCFLPTNCLMLAHYVLFDGRAAAPAADSSYALYLVFLCVGSLNCVLDPMVYYFGSSQCQRQLSGLLRCGKAAAQRGGTISHTSSDSCRSSTRTILKSSRTGSTTAAPTDSYRADLNGQYKKLLV